MNRNEKGLKQIDLQKDKEFGRNYAYYLVKKRRSTNFMERSLFKRIYTLRQHVGLLNIPIYIFYARANIGLWASYRPIRGYDKQLFHATQELLTTY